MLSVVNIGVGKSIGSRVCVSLANTIWNKFGTMSQEITAANGPIESSISEKLTKTLKPVHLQIINESYMHNVPKGSETHFKVLVVSECFNNQPLLQRHRLVNDVLKDELQGSVHALSIQAKTPEQWDKMVASGNTVITPSPHCRGGFGK